MQQPELLKLLLEKMALAKDMILPPYYWV